MKYEIAENEILAKLNANAELTAISDNEVLPDSVDDYKTPVHKGLVTVVFLSEKHDANQSIGQVSQHTTVTFNVSIQARLLRGLTGVYAIAEEIKKTLIGFAPSDCGPLSLGQHEFAGYQNDVWEHSITFSCRSLRTQEYGSHMPGNSITDNDVYYTKNKIDENIHV